MAQRLDLAIAPGKHLGWFRLGTSLWDIIRLLRDQAALIPVVDLKYSEENPFAADIVLRLASNGIELRFEPLSQRLKLIKVDDFSRLRLTYQGGEVSSAKALPTFLLAYKLFGPTYPGEFDGSKHLYTLSYPVDLPLEFPDGTTPVASHMYIYYSADWTTAAPVPISTLVRNIQESNSPGHHGGRFGEGKTELERVIARINYGVSLQFAGMTPQQKCLILLHVTTPQDLLADLGSPASIYYKEEDKMKIHSDTKETSKNQDEDDGILGSMDDVGGGYERSNHQAESMDNADAASFPPIAPSSSSFTPSPSRQHDMSSPPQQQQQNTLHAEGKTGKKKSKGGARPGDASDASPPLNSSSSSPTPGGQFETATPERTGVSPSPSDGVEALSGFDNATSQHRQQQQQQQQQQHQSTSGLTSVLPERGITPDMKISMIMALLEPPSTSTHSSTLTAATATSNAGGTAVKPAVILNRGSSTQNPFGPTTLNGADGVVFEAMKNGHVATVILY
ncbi:hypothetical protein BGZ94_005997 [Podila epigama]|nr:hypothetical protein BGZ94_005997 [Podila epigama]